MRLLLFGAPGSGKGTQAVRLAQRFGVAHIASGDLLREQVRAGTPLGREVAGFLDRGDLVPDELVVNVLIPAMARASEAGGYVLDGFPRTMEQGEATYRSARELGVTVHAAVYLRADEEELLKRLLRRAGEQDRTDDEEAVIRHRLEVFQTRTTPLIDYYDGRGVLVSVDAIGTPDEVTRRVVDGITAVAATGPEQAAGSGADG